MVTYPNLRTTDVIALDIETRDDDLLDLGPGYHRGKPNEILCISIGTRDKGWSFPWNENTQAWLKDHEHLSVVGANILYDLGWLAVSAGIQFTGRLYDILTIESLIDGGRSWYSLDKLAKQYLGEQKQDYSLREYCDNMGWKGDPRKHLWKIYADEPQLILDYVQSDAQQTFQIWEKQQRAMIEKNLHNVYILESELIPVLLRLRMNGVRIDVEQLHRTHDMLTPRIEALAKEANHIAGMEVNTASAASCAKAFDLLGLPYGTTDKGNPSITKDTLELVQHPFAEKVAEVRRLRKLQSTYIEGFERFVVNGRVYTEFIPVRNGKRGTVTGRFSCVAPETNVTTRHGDVPISSNMLKIGDVVFTHKGRWRPIKRKIMKGVDTMYRITLESGDCVTCTQDHRIWNGADWKYVSDLSIGDVIENVYIQGTFKQPRNCTKSISGVSKQQKTYHCDDRQAMQCNVSHGTSNSSTKFEQRRIRLREKVAMVAGKNRRKKSDERKIWKQASFISRKLFRSQRLCNTNLRGWLRKIFCTSHSHGRINRNTSITNSSRIRGTSYRRRYLKQLTRKSGTCNKKSPLEFTRIQSKIQNITYMGQVCVYDLEIEEDHSYLAEGMFHHNSQNPALQTIPSRGEGKQLARRLFLPEEGMIWEKQDQSQEEYRIFAHYARGGGADMLQHGYSVDPDFDMHIFARDFVGFPQTNDGRSLAKTLNFGSMYLMGVHKFALQIGEKPPEPWSFNSYDEYLDQKAQMIAHNKAARLYFAYHDKLSCIKTTSKAAQKMATERGYARTMLNRRRYLGSREEHKALNTAVQGTGGEIMKLWLVQCEKDGVFNTVVPHLTVHDEIDFSVSEGAEGDQASERIKEIGETCLTLRVPLKVDRERGPNWADVQ